MRRQETFNVIDFEILFMVVPAEASIFADRLEASWEYPRIPDRRAGIMKYRSGNARRVLTRGAFAFESSDRISSSFLFRYVQENCFVPLWSKVAAAISRVNFLVAL